MKAFAQQFKGTLAARGSTIHQALSPSLFKKSKKKREAFPVNIVMYG